MSNSLVNIRFGSWHFQILRDAPYIEVGHNAYHDIARTKPGWRWFAVHEFFGYSGN